MTDHKTNVRDSSLEAFQKLLDGGKLSGRRKELFGIFAKAGQPVCDYTASQLWNRPINCVTPRRQELEQMGYLRDCGKLPAPPNNESVHHFEVNPECMEPGWMPKPISKRNKPKRINADVSAAGRLLRSYRDKKRQRPVVLPLFADMRF
jgi:hypothetical protein